VVADLEKGSPMDRLIVGDVGFGKTEVAMRAAFVAALSGMQVAVICPTTLLARQHYRSFAERFRGFPINRSSPCRALFQRRMRTATREGMADGHGGYLCRHPCAAGQGDTLQEAGSAGHRRGAAFRRGPQGTAEGDAVRGACADPDRDADSAHAATVADRGAGPVDHRDAAGGPPGDPHLCFRIRHNHLREALLRERFRGGQSFYVVPRIADLHDIEEFLRTHVPEVSYVIAHGQLAAGDLDDRMNQFYDGKYDVLLATTIVESGLDIPTANTMIVHRADMFGLSQLYQIRGRVGRSKTRAYCYLTTKPRAPLTPQA
jgi:transcription-repair coupling factor (superfamily II helicase)